MCFCFCPFFCPGDFFWTFSLGHWLETFHKQKRQWDKRLAANPLHLTETWKTRLHHQLKLLWKESRRIYDNNPKKHQNKHEKSRLPLGLGIFLRWDFVWRWIKSLGRWIIMFAYNWIRCFLAAAGVSSAKGGGHVSTVERRQNGCSGRHYLVNSVVTCRICD